MANTSIEQEALLYQTRTQLRKWPHRSVDKEAAVKTAASLVAVPRRVQQSFVIQAEQLSANTQRKR